MARSAHGPWFRTSKNAWYCTAQGKAVYLGVKGECNRAEAVRAWHRLMAGDNQNQEVETVRAPALSLPTPIASCEDSLEVLVDAFLQERQHIASETLRIYTRFLQQFASAFGNKPISARAVEQWASHCPWTASTQNSVIGIIFMFCKWAVAAGKWDRNPIEGIRRPPTASRGHDAVISEENHLRLVAVAKKPWGDYLRLLWETGARPGEISGLTVEDVTPALDVGVVVLHKHKTARKTGKPRIIILTEEAKDILCQLVAKRRKGLLFPNKQGQPMSVQAIGSLMRRLGRRAGIKAIAYGYRHTFATDALANGVPDAQVSALLGHSGTAMLHQHYSHLTSRSQVLREALSKVR